MTLTSWNRKGDTVMEENIKIIKTAIDFELNQEDTSEQYLNILYKKLEKEYELKQERVV